MPAAACEIRLLGPVAARVAGVPAAVGGPQQRTLLALLACAEGRAVATETLMHRLWPGPQPRDARHTLHVLVSNLRRGLGTSVIESLPGGYRLTTERVTIDAEVIRALLADTEGMPAHRAAHALRAGLESWRGRSLADISDRLPHEAAALDELRLEVLERRIDADLALGRGERVVAEVRELVHDHPLREGFRRQLMSALYSSGRQSEALDEYHLVRQLLLDELGIEPGPGLRALHAQILRQDPELDPAPLRARPELHLVGRGTSLDELQGLVQQRGALVSITGPGGAGKTALALALLQRAAGSFRDGAVLVDLTRVGTADAVIAEAARTLDLRVADGRGVAEQLAAYLATRSLLLVLDNAEHVIDGVTELCGVAEAAPSCVLVVTSRAVLRIAREQEYELPPLTLDDAVTLFLNRATRVAAMQPDAAIARDICRRLDGLPLAVELAAARLRYLSPKVLLERLASRLSMLTAGPRDAPARQQTLRATIDWSYALLGQDARLLLDRLSVFAGSFDLEAAEEVCAASLDELAALVDQSMVVRRPTAGGELRFALLETVREFAAERLEERGETLSTRHRARAWMIGLGEEARGGLCGPDQERWRRRLEDELGNIREAVALAASEAPGVAATLCASLEEVWLHLHLYQEGNDAARAALLSLEDGRSEIRCGVLSVLARTALYKGDLKTARWASEQILSFGEPGGARIVAEMTIAHIEAFDGNLEAARSAAEASLALAEEAGHEWLVAWSHGTLGIVLFHEGRESEVVPAMLESRRRMAATGDARSLFMLDSNIAELLLGAGRAAEANDLLVRLVERAAEVDDRYAEAYPHFNRGVCELFLGRHDAARRILAECVHAAIELDNSMLLSETGTATAALLALDGDETAALTLYLASAEHLGAQSGFYSLVPLRRDVLEPLKERLLQPTEGNVHVGALGTDALAAAIMRALGRPVVRAWRESLRTLPDDHAAVESAASGRP